MAKLRACFEVNGFALADGWMARGRWWENGGTTMRLIEWFKKRRALKSCGSKCGTCIHLECVSVMPTVLRCRKGLW